MFLSHVSFTSYTVSKWHTTTRCEEGDVNAIFQFRGVWHIMHQFRNRPRTSIGHQTSTDLLHWARLPDALESGNATDEQCYDGGVSLVPQAGTGIMQPMIMIDGGCARKGKPGPYCMESSGNETGGVIAFPSTLSDPNLTSWDRLGPTRWEPCNGTAWPSPIWLNRHTGKFNVLAVYEYGEARYEAADESFTDWRMMDSAFMTGIRGLGGGMWHKLPPNVDGVTGGRWATHIFQGALGRAFNGLPNFVMGVYDEKKQTYTNVSRPMLLDAGGGVNYGQLSWQQSPSDERCLFVSWLRLTEPAPPDCGTQGQLTAIRDLRYDPRLNILVHTPIAEYYRLRSKAPLFATKGALALSAGAPPRTLLAAAAGSGAGVAMDLEFNVSLPASAPSATSATVSLRCADVTAACTHGTVITLEVGAMSAADGSRRVTMHVDYEYHIPVSFTLLKGEVVLPLRVLSDTRSLEIFAAGGRGVVSITMLSVAGIVTAATTAEHDVEVKSAAWELAL